MLLSCHVQVLEWSTLYSLTECQGTPCSNQGPYLKELIPTIRKKSEKTNQPFSTKMTKQQTDRQTENVDFIGMHNP